jgi:hypothetical protein
VDFDNDGVVSFYDLCPDTDAGELADEDGCSWEQYDDDDDGVLNSLDGCPDTTAKSVDADGCAEYQKDTDEDGVSDADDACPNSFGYSEHLGCAECFPGELNIPCENCGLACFCACADDGTLGTGHCSESCTLLDNETAHGNVTEDDDNGFLPAPSLAVSVAAMAVIALRSSRNT